MVFSSLIFIFIFLPLVLVSYYIVPKRFKNSIILLASLIFYAWGEPVYVLLIIVSILINYFGALLIRKYISDKEKSKFVFITVLLIDISVLFFFKYYGFAIESLGSILGLNLQVKSIALPLGVSFYTFQQISYIADIYMQRVKPQKNLIDFAAYITMFPQLIAGPIVNYNDIYKQLANRKESISKFGEGVQRFIIGLGKKVILANNIGLIWSQVKEIPLNDLSVVLAWIGIIAFTLQIYFDFSGYSDMAIGLAKMFGFDFLENFDYPYISKSITEFWRRWHMSLGGWFREYIYIPLGGNKKGTLIQVRNLFVVWFATGLWHGASTNFIVWGLYFGVILLIEKLYLKDLLKRIPTIFSHIYTLIIVIIGWVIFDMNTLPAAGHYIKIMFGLGSNIFIDNMAKYILSTNFIILLLGLICSTKLIKNYTNKLKSTLKEKDVFLVASINLLILIISTAYLVGASYNPFLYFRF
ncbi:MBOAT family protein [Clostridium sp. NSJ-6]|uniref:MBOAT family protein n=1 Tax=Clostridium hominis TaxID=2763036 RepID=A0ABR7DH02_9CLOT|nr:MBOAT family protein [Clostridium hominis]MBC5630690.1 MBOAT family protein [Clostridium hominis]MDU2670472.1 MBOAT family protein [Clostridium sp.]